MEIQLLADPVRLGQAVEGGDHAQRFLGHLDGAIVTGAGLLGRRVSAGLKQVHLRQASADGEVAAGLVLQSTQGWLDDPLQVADGPAKDGLFAARGHGHVLGRCGNQPRGDVPFHLAGVGQLGIAGPHLDDGLECLVELLVLHEQLPEAMAGRVGGCIVGELLVQEAGDVDGPFPVGLASGIGQGRSGRIGGIDLDCTGGAQIAAEGHEAGGRRLAAGAPGRAGNVFAQDGRLLRLAGVLVKVHQAQQVVGHVGGRIIVGGQISAAFEQRQHPVLAAGDLGPQPARFPSPRRPERGLGFGRVLQGVSQRLFGVQELGHLDERRHLGGLERDVLRRGLVRLTEQPANHGHAVAGGPGRVVIVRLRQCPIQLFGLRQLPGALAPIVTGRLGSLGGGPIESSACRCNTTAR